MALDSEMKNRQAGAQSTLMVDARIEMVRLAQDLGAWFW